jgi:hypothetical protein
MRTYGGSQGPGPVGQGELASAPSGRATKKLASGGSQYNSQYNSQYSSHTGQKMAMS